MSSAENPNSIPLQIARSLTCDHTKARIGRGIDQLRLTWHIHRHFSKEEVLTIYANRAYFGPGLTGVERASKEFFHKEPNALSITEAALIAGLIRGPGVYSPRKHPDRALQRRNKVLELMVAQGKLSAGEATRLEATPLGTQ
jgi:membrane peptidoglycan carboxypeptidase